MTDELRYQVGRLDLRIRALEAAEAAMKKRISNIERMVDPVEDLENEQIGIKGRLRELENQTRIVSRFLATLARASGVSPEDDDDSRRSPDGRWLP